MENRKAPNSQAPLLKDIAYDKIKDSILQEEFSPGQFLSERELIEILQMSKTPIKSALTRLEAEGFVTVSSKLGIIINDFSIDRIIDIYDLRKALEVFVATQICGRLSAEQCNAVEKNLRETEDFVNELDVKGFTLADHAFHLLLCEFSGNREIHRVLLNYQDHLRRITLRHLKKDKERMRLFLQEHVEIFKNLKQGNAAGIELMTQHLQNAKKTLFI
ncbi:MAG: GntR family transcriptional regulator [Bacilli bacterium]|nr:GntR family transcriptional regulator [Bacilli bacterium]